MPSRATPKPKPLPPTSSNRNRAVSNDRDNPVRLQNRLSFRRTFASREGNETDSTSSCSRYVHVPFRSHTSSKTGVVGLRLSPRVSSQKRTQLEGHAFSNHIMSWSRLLHDQLVIADSICPTRSLRIGTWTCSKNGEMLVVRTS